MTLSRGKNVESRLKAHKYLEAEETASSKAAKGGPWEGRRKGPVPGALEMGSGLVRDFC